MSSPSIPKGSTSVDQAYQQQINALIAAGGNKQQLDTWLDQIEKQEGETGVSGTGSGVSSGSGGGGGGGKPLGTPPGTTPPGTTPPGTTPPGTTPPGTTPPGTTPPGTTPPGTTPPGTTPPGTTPPGTTPPGTTPPGTTPPGTTPPGTTPPGTTPPGTTPPGTTPPGTTPPGTTPPGTTPPGTTPPGTTPPGTTPPGDNNLYSCDGLNLPPAIQPYESDINATAEKYKIPAALLASQIEQESSGNPDAITTNSGIQYDDNGTPAYSPDVGLGQVDAVNYLTYTGATPEGANGMYSASQVAGAVTKLEDPATNIDAMGLWYTNNGGWQEGFDHYAVDPSYKTEVQAKITAMGSDLQV